MTLSEITKLYVAVVFYVHLESTVFLLMYNFQDSVGPDNVFYIVHTVYAVFDIFIVVCDFILKKNTSSTAAKDRMLINIYINIGHRLALHNKLWTPMNNDTVT